MEELMLMKREKTACHSVRKVRREGKVPGVIYGAEIGNELFTIDKGQLEKELAAEGEHAVVKFNLDGKSGMALIKDIQKSPVEHRVIHVDLEEVADDYNMHTEVAIKIEGKGLLESKSLILQTQKDFVKIVCKAKDLPKEFVLDVSDAKAGSVYTVKDLNVTGNIKLDEDLNDVIGSVSMEERVEDEAAATEE